MIPAHPYAEEFPMMSPLEAAGLRVDLSENGQRERIAILDDMILDGRNRQREGEAIGLLPSDLPPPGDDLWISHYRRFNPAQDGDPLAWVVSKNLHRRHLSDSQRSMIAAGLARLGRGRPKADSEKPANLPVIPTQPEAAAMMGVSERSVRSAAQVRDQGAPELVARVRSGEVAVSAAADLSTLPVGEQLRILRENNPREFGAAVRQFRQQPKDARAVTNSRVQPPDDLDYSPTPPWATRSLTKIVLPQLGVSLTGMVVREPACGEGHITAVLQEERPLRIWASDIFDYSVDGVEPPEWTGDRDYLDPKESFGGADWVITNSPFGTKAEAFALRALEEASVGVAMFLRLGWLASKGRFNRLFSINPPTLIAIFSEDVPLHMGRWEPEGSTLSDYMWLVWIKGEPPRAPFWIPPEQRTLLSKPDDVARFTAHPVVGLVEARNDAAATSAAIATDKATALPIIAARYTGDNAQQLADELGRPINTVRKWAFELGKTDAARNVARIQDINRERAQ